MLFLPWRNEEEEVKNQNCETIYNENKEVINANYAKFNKIHVDLDEMVRAYQAEQEQIDAEMEAEGNSDPNETEEDPNFVNVFNYDENIIQPNFMVNVGQ